MQELRLWVSQTWVGIPTQATQCCVTVGESLIISEPLLINWESDTYLISRYSNIIMLIIPLLRAAFVEPFSIPNGCSKHPGNV